ncbi:response regulator [Sphingobacterium sp. SRCM116780]|uniref:response regulator n=1 Tax=Sphingobacterium sp. SRCM116780 TaxID=2907623 RepID=UPI001F46AAA4|nr:response regulator [Sphingobacterium sp. SRCM116780]UIR55185.1 response regulator [Sphingobacterium sp. SRCM116780]
MKKLRFQQQLIIGIIFSFLIILSAALLFFTQLDRHIAYEQSIIQASESKFDQIENIKKSVAAVNDVKLEYYTDKKESIYTPYARELTTILDAIKNLSNSDQYYTIDNNKLNTLKNTILEFYDFEQDIELNKKNEFHVLNVNHKRSDIQNQLTIFTKELQDQRKELILSSNNKLMTIRHVTYVLVFIGLSIMVYIFVVTLRVFKILKKSINDEKKSNAELVKLTNKIEQDNYFLNNINLLDENLRGDFNEIEIANIGLKSICKTTNALAGTVYVKKEDSNFFSLLAKQGIPAGIDLKNIISEGDGLLNDVIEQQNFRIIHDVDAARYAVSSSLIDKFQTHLYLIPIVYENESIGIIELACQSDNKKEHQHIEYLKSVSRILAISLKVAQAHTKMAELYEELQQQTEELEAQQEELRTTNEELSYKTNLLEASEEELRVQQEELVQTNNELDEKANLLQQQNNELEKAKDNIALKIKEVELASKYKSEFMANMSHELRTPLNSILILAKLLQDNKNKNLTPEQIKYSAVIHNAGSDLLHLINDLLDLAKIESGKVELSQENIDIKDLTNYIEDFFKNAAEDKKINFKIALAGDVPTHFISDEYRLQQILKNLISNAFKFTNPGGDVTINIDKTIDNHLLFKVVDTGIGIAPDKQKLIFEAFKQEDGSTSRKYGGTGLGLSICRETSQLLGGKIDLMSEVGAGSTFILTIPLVTSASSVEEVKNKTVVNEEKTAIVKSIESSSKIPENKSSNKVIEDSNTLLIIEDDLVFADILKDYAEVNNYHVTLAHDGEQGLEKALTLKPKAIILDIMLPKIDGWNVLKALKANEDTKSIPVHMMSAGTYLHNEPISAGAIGFMSKPVSEESLEKTFEKIRSMITTSVKRVLLIEDHQIQSDFIKNGLEEEKLIVDQAYDANKASELLANKANKYDCIILDLHLPDKSGLELLDEIKADATYAETPIIINTAMELTSEQTSRILKHSQAMVLKSAKSNDRLIDEVHLFLNKINQDPENKAIVSYKTKDFIPEKTLENKTILLADDDMRNIFALSSAFEDLNVRVEIANNGQEALDLLNKENKIDLVLMDIMMPIMDGYEAIENIRKNKKYQDLPIIAVTAKAMKGDKEKAIEAGANDYISKPIDIDKLISLIRVWVS